MLLSIMGWLCDGDDGSDADVFIQRSVAIGNGLAFRQLLHEAQETVAIKDIPFIHQSIDSLSSQVCLSLLKIQASGSFRRKLNKVLHSMDETPSWRRII